MHPTILSFRNGGDSHNWISGNCVALLQMRRLIESDPIDQLAKALSWYQNGMDFADALHLSLAIGADRLITFDERVINATTAQRPPVQLLK